MLPLAVRALGGMMQETFRLIVPVELIVPPSKPVPAVIDVTAGTPPQQIPFAPVDSKT
jgi:hypothetical protein